MGKNDPRVDAYIAAAAPFARPILKHLRKTVHEAVPEVKETMKWSFPHFDYQGIFCSMASFKAHCAFGFWQHRMLEKRVGLAGKADDAMGSFGRLTSVKDLPSRAALVKIIKEAKAIRDSGEREATPRRKRAPLEAPGELMAALRRNGKALATFEGFTPTNRRDYIEWIVEAKGEETRKRRLETAVAWMAEGKSRHWKYALR